MVLKQGEKAKVERGNGVIENERSLFIKEKAPGYLDALEKGLDDYEAKAFQLIGGAEVHRIPLRRLGTSEEEIRVLMRLCAAKKARGYFDKLCNGQSFDSFYQDIGILYTEASKGGMSQEELDKINQKLPSIISQHEQAQLVRFCKRDLSLEYEKCLMTAKDIIGQSFVANQTLPEEIDDKIDQLLSEFYKNPDEFKLSLIV